MTKIYFIGDTHFGKSYPFKKNYELNISERNLDVINNCEKIIKDAIEEKADFVIFLGDLYDRQNISPTIRRIVREKIFIPLYEAKIPTIIIGGNHDSIRNPNRGADIQELGNFSNVDVYTGLYPRIIPINGVKLGFLFLPYIHFDILVEIAKSKKIEIERDDHNYKVAQNILKNYIKQICNSKLKDADKRILIGHYYLEGAKIREINNPSMIYGEFQFNKEMLQRQFFDLIIFGHMHLRQTMWNDERIVIPGSIDRIDMSERNSQKYYCIYDVEKDNLEFKEIDCRNHVKLEIEIPDNSKNLIQFILDALPERTNLQDSICRLVISYPKGKEVKLDKNKIERYFEGSFYTDIIYKEKRVEEPEGLREVNLDPKSLYHDFLIQKYVNHKHYENLKKIGSELIDKEFSLVDSTAKGPISIESINIQNFNKYGKGPNKIIFDKDLYVIKGPTGSGKSSILDAITFALFKRSTRKDVGLNLDEILYEKGYVNLELLIGSDKLSVKRNQVSPKLDIKLNNNPIFLGMNVPEKEKKLEEIIGYDYEGFISSFFIRQQELQIFSTLSTKDRHERLVKLFKLKIFHNIYKKLKSTIDNLQREHDKYQGGILELKKLVEQLPKKEENLKFEFDKLKQKEEKRDRLLIESKDIEIKRNNLQEDATKYLDSQKEIEEVTENIEKIKEEIDEYKQKQNEFTEIENQLTGMKDFKDDKIKLENEKEEIEKKIHKKELIQAEIKNSNNLIKKIKTQYDEQLKRLEKQIQDKKDRVSQLKTAITKEEAFQTLKDEGILTERFSRLKEIEIPMAKEYKDIKRIKEFSFLIKKTQEDLENIQPKRSGITKDIFIADELGSDKNALEEERIKVQRKREEEIIKSEENIKNYNNKIKEGNLDQNLKEVLKTVKDSLTKIQDEEQLKEELEKKLKQKKDYSLLINKEQEKINKLDNQLVKFNSELKKLKAPYQKYTNLVEEYNEIKLKLQQIEIDITGLNMELKYIKKEVKNIKKTAANIEKITHELKLIQDKIEYYTILREDIFHLNGIPKFAIEKILPNISIRASEILSDLTNGRFNHIKFKSLGNNRVGFEIFVFDGERDREASSFSGGEKTQINAAIRFAIMERIAEIPDTSGAIFRKSNTLLIDEGDLGTLDDESARQRFVDKIFELKSMFKKIILITHLEEVAEQFPNRVLIGWDKSGKSKIFT